MESLKTQYRKYTYEEYLELEKNSELKHEFYYGEIFSMAGTTKKHNQIGLNITFSLKNKLKKTNENCNVYFETLKVEIDKKGHYTYPDVVISCQENEDDNLTIKQPILIIEVLSNSTREYDSGQKFTFYKQIPSLKHYILVEQDFCLITSYTKDNKFWYHQAYTKLNDIIKLEHLKINISIKDIYENIVFAKKQKFPI